jgi:outer membrane protein OmpA-like peptidoglycan-associated protein
MSRAWNVTLTQPLFNWDKWSQFRQGDMNASIAEAKFASAEQDLVIRVTEAYFNVLNTQDTLNLARNKKVLIGEQLEQAKRNFEVGTSTITDTHEAQSRYDLVVAQELAAEADLVIKRGALEQVTGKQITQIKSLSHAAKIDAVAKDRKVKLKKGEKPTPVNVQQVVAVQPGQSIQDWVKQAEDVSYSIIAEKEGYLVVKDQITTVGLTESTTFVKEYFLQPFEKTGIPLPQILYDVDEFFLRPEAKDSLETLYQTLVDNPNIVIELRSHTDARPTRRYKGGNKELSQKRAQSCVNYLVEKGIDPARMVPVGMGPDEPVVTMEQIKKMGTKEEQEAAHQRNRRTDFKVLRSDFVPGGAAPQPPAPNN